MKKLNSINQADFEIGDHFQGRRIIAKDKGNNPIYGGEVTEALLKVGTQFYDVDPTPIPGKLFANGTYNIADNPILIAKHTANPHEFFVLNADGLTFTMADVSEFIVAGTADIGKFFTDTTAVNGLKGTVTRRYKTNTSANGGAHRFSSAGSSNNATVAFTGDPKTAPEHRPMYFGLWGDQAFTGDLT